MRFVLLDFTTSSHELFDASKQIPYLQWLPSGEAFRISDLVRLESETLPQYFRHNRFQSLVRQLNFYNFRKINRERTFWVYYHPLFHRDRPEEMPKLRRRTCPGYDGRKNRPSGGLSPYDDMMGEDEDIDEYAASTATMVTPPGVGSEISRSPSPSFSPMNHAPAGKGSVVRSSITKDSSLKSVVSVEEKGHSDEPKAMRRQVSSTSSSFGAYDSQNSFYRSDGDNSPDFSSYQSPTDPSEAEDYDVEQLNQRARTSTMLRKSSRKNPEASAAAVSSDNEDDFSAYSSSPATCKKYSKEKNQERQDHILAVLEVSRHLNGICSDYNASISKGKPRGRGGRVCSGSAPSPVFGLDKPHDHYYGAGKFDLFTYDCEDGFVIDEDDRGCAEREKLDEEDGFPSFDTPNKVPSEPAIIPLPPSQCPIVTQSLAQACLEGRIVDCTSTFDRTLASAILWFCLSTHPLDPDLANKISHHMKKRPMLAQEFEMYCMAMSPGEWGKVSASEDLKRNWKMFATNFMNRVVLSYHKHMRLTELENEAIVALECWFQDE